MHLPQLYKVLQDTNTTDELMLFILSISSTYLMRARQTYTYIFADRIQGPFRT